MKTVHIEKHYHVYCDPEGVKLIVAPDDDGLNLVQLSTKDKPSSEFFGETRLVVTPEMARKLANSLLASADDCVRRD